VRFAVVARDLDRQAFESYLDAFLGEARIDRPDAAGAHRQPAGGRRLFGAKRAIARVSRGRGGIMLSSPGRREAPTPRGGGVAAGMTGFLDRIRSDVVFTAILARTLRRIIPLAHKTTLILPDVIEDLAAKYGDRPALLSETGRH
jgi:hypothetical protein